MKWQDVFRRGFAPQLSSAGLVALRAALVSNDKRLIQQATMFPPPLEACACMPCEAACAICFTHAFVSKTLLKTVADVEEFFGRVCHDADQTLGESGAVRWFLNWFDDAPREEMRAALLVEVDAELARRQAVTPVQTSALPPALLRAAS
jgi:hypothetical protein